MKKNASCQLAFFFLCYPFLLRNFIISCRVKRSLRLEFDVSKMFIFSRRYASLVQTKSCKCPLFFFRGEHIFSQQLYFIKPDYLKIAKALLDSFVII